MVAVVEYVELGTAVSKTPKLRLHFRPSLILGRITRDAFL